MVTSNLCAETVLSTHQTGYYVDKILIEEIKKVVTCPPDKRCVERKRMLAGDAMRPEVETLTSSYDGQLIGTVR